LRTMNRSFLPCVVVGALLGGGCGSSSSDPPVIGAAGGGTSGPEVAVSQSEPAPVATVSETEASAEAPPVIELAEVPEVTEEAPVPSGITAPEMDADAVVTMATPPVASGVDDPGTAGDGDFTVTTLTMQPELTNRGAPQGRRFQFVMDSTRSTIFDGSDATVNPAERHLTRQVTVYIPAQYEDGTPAPILVLQDGPPSAGGWGDTAPFDAVTRALDNLTTSTDPARRLPPFIAIGVENGGSDSKGSERGLEYDTLSDRYARFVDLEVLPAVLGDAAIRAAYPGLAITADPEGRATYGCSSGAAASFTMAWFRPDLFRRVITYSGTFVAQQNAGQPETPLYPGGAWEYHSGLQIIANTDPMKAVRVHLNVNERDNGYTAPESGQHNWVLANQRMAAVLKTKGYHYRFNFVPGLGHCDYNAWRATLADTLIWTWRGYPTN
jgi:iron(III)-enterobactin esterase